MGAADIVALSSIFEGLPRVAVQAVCPSHLWEPMSMVHQNYPLGKNGFLVPSRNPLLLSEALQKV